MTRERLPDRRASEQIAFECGGFRYMATISRFPDQRLAEIFLNGAKVGTDLAIAASDAAISASLYFQRGGSVDELRHALTRNGDGSAARPVGHLLDILAADEA